MNVFPTPLRRADFFDGEWQTRLDRSRNGFPHLLLALDAALTSGFDGLYWPAGGSWGSSPGLVLSFLVLVGGLVGQGPSRGEERVEEVMEWATQVEFLGGFEQAHLVERLAQAVENGFPGLPFAEDVPRVSSEVQLQRSGRRRRVYVPSTPVGTGDPRKCGRQILGSSAAVLLEGQALPPTTGP